MTTQRTRLKLIALLGCPALLFSLIAPITSYTLAGQLVRDEGLQAIEVIHKQNIGQLHGLHHEMRATLKQLTRDRNDQEAGRQLAIQLRVVNQSLDTIAATEKDHPQWAVSWSQRHARLVVLTQEMETLLTGPGSGGGNRPLHELGKKLQEMKEILDIW
jgi:hypothetical protein